MQDQQHHRGPSPGVRRSRVLLVLTTAGMVLGAVAVLALHDPAKHSYLPPCIFHEITGLYCPGCGTCRAAHQLLRGNFLGALAYNPLTVLAAPFLVYALIWQLVNVSTGRRLPYVALPGWSVWALLWLIVGYTILRNLPWHPFTWLAP